MNGLSTKTITCIVCPMGCKIDVTLNGEQVKDISGNTCKRGYEYAQTEFTHPTRTLTSTVRISNPTAEKLLPVRTSAPIPKSKLFDAMEFLNGLAVKAPIKRGEVIYRDFIEKGTELIACKSVE